MREERNYTGDVLAFLNHLKLEINLWRALMSSLDTTQILKEAHVKGPQLQFTKGSYRGSYRGGA